ncbi:MAG: LamG-like jellyroll fold domain-containing protein, partial [Planctomycetota bacterium]
MAKACFGQSERGASSNRTKAARKRSRQERRRAIFETLDKRELLAADPVASNDAYTVTPVASILSLGFDEADGSSILNEAGSTVGQLAGNPFVERIPGPSGNAVRSSGSDGHALITPTPELDALGQGDADFSMAFWLRLDETHQGSWRQILLKGNNGYERGPAVYAHPTSNRLHVRLSTDHSSNEGLDSVASLEVARWTHVAMVKSGRQWSLYLDGVLDSSVTLTGASVGNNGPLRIGSTSFYPSSFSIDNVVAMDRPLNAEELGQLSTNHSPSLMSVSGDVSVNDVDPDGDISTFEVITPPADGHLDLDPNGSFTYLTANPVAVPARFTYRVTDQIGNTDTAVAFVNRLDRAPQANPDSQIADGLEPAVGFGFEESGGNDILGYSGAVIGQSTGPQTIQRVPGPVGNAAKFEFAGDQVQIDPTPEMSSLGTADADFSMAFWLRLDEGPIGYHRQILLKGNNSIERGPAVYAHPNSNKLHVRLSTTYSFNDGIDSLGSLPVGQWTHVAMVKSGSTWSLYFNGVLDRSTTLQGASLGNTGPLTLGSPASHPSKFAIDDIVAVNRPLADNEVSALATAGSPTFAKAQGNVSSNDFDVDSNISHFELVTPPSTGTVDLNSDGTFSYVTGDSTALPTAFTYRVVDQDGQSSTAAALILAGDQLVNPVVREVDVNLDGHVDLVTRAIDGADPGPWVIALSDGLGDYSVHADWQDYFPADLVLETAAAEDFQAPLLHAADAFARVHDEVTFTPSKQVWKHAEQTLSANSGNAWDQSLA